MSLTERLAILISADGNGAVREFERVGRSAEKDLGKAEGVGARMASNMVKSGALMMGVGAVFEAAFFKAAEAADVHEIAILKLDNSIEHSDKVARGSSEAFQQQAEALAQTTVVGRDTTLTMQAMLVQLGATEQQVLALTPLIGDISRKMGIDEVTAAKAVGMALDGKATALKKLKIPLDDALYKTDRYAAVTQALAHAQGFAATEGETFTGQLEILKNQMGEVEAGVGVGAVHAFQNLLGPVKSATDALKGMSPEAQSMVGEIGTYAATIGIAAGATLMFAGFIAKNVVAINAARAAHQAKAAAAAEDAAATAAEGAAEAEATGETTAHAAAMELMARANAEEATSAVAAGAATSGMMLAIAGTGVLAIAALDMVFAKMRDAANENNKELFKKVDFTKDFGENAKAIDEVGTKVQAMRDHWNAYSDAEKVMHAQEKIDLNAANDQLDEYVNHHDAVLGVLEKVRDELHISGPEAQKYAAALKIDPTSVGYDQLKGAISDMATKHMTAADAAAAHGISLEALNSDAEETAKGLKALDSATVGLIDAQHGYADSGQRVQDAQYNIAQSAQKVTDAQDAYVSATQKVVDAEEARVDSLRKVRDAQEKVADAQRKLDEIMSGGKHGDDYDLGKREAALRLKEANEKVADSEKALSKARTPADRQKATDALEQARIDLLRAQNAALDANAAQSTDAASATDSLNQAKTSLTGAEKAAKQAAEAVTKAQHDQAKAAEAITRASHDQEKATRDLDRARWDSLKALDALISKSEDLTKAQDENKGSAQAVIQKYRDMLALDPSLAPVLNPLIASAGGAPLPARPTRRDPGQTGEDRGVRGFGGQPIVVQVDHTTMLDGRAIYRNQTSHAVAFERGSR